MDGTLLAFIIFSAYSLYLMDKVRKNTKKKDSRLTRSEKIQVILLLLLNTLPSWIIFSFGWKKKLPVKSKQVNRYVLVIFGTLIGLAILGIVVAVLLSAINPAGQINR